MAHKEKLKKMRTLVDVLTLSATPIPRTLHLSLASGIRDLSVINTPPRDKGFPSEPTSWSSMRMRLTAVEELARQGQVFLSTLGAFDICDYPPGAAARAACQSRSCSRADEAGMDGQTRPGSSGRKAMYWFVQRSSVPVWIFRRPIRLLSTAPKSSVWRSSIRYADAWTIPAGRRLPICLLPQANTFPRSDERLQVVGIFGSGLRFGLHTTIWKSGAAEKYWGCPSRDIFPPSVTSFIPN